MDELLIAVEAAWEELWRPRLFNLRHDLAVAEYGIATAKGAPTFWTKRADDARHEIALLEGVENAIWKARKA